MNSVIGFFASVCFLFCGFPPLYTFLKTGINHTPLSLALFILGGSSLMGLYVFLTMGLEPVLSTLYLIESLTWLVLVFGGRGK